MVGTAVAAPTGLRRSPVLLDPRDCTLALRPALPLLVDSVVHRSDARHVDRSGSSDVIKGGGRVAGMGPIRRAGAMRPDGEPPVSHRVEPLVGWVGGMRWSGTRSQHMMTVHHGASSTPTLHWGTGILRYTRRKVLFRGQINRPSRGYRANEVT